MKPMPNSTLALTFWLRCSLPSVRSAYRLRSVRDVCVMEISLRIRACNNNFTWTLPIRMRSTTHT